MATVMERLMHVQNVHDAEEMAALFAPDYRSFSRRILAGVSVVELRCRRTGPLSSRGFRTSSPNWFHRR